MPSDLILPFVMASAFTAGWVLIHKLERYAELVGNLLGFLFLLCTLLCAVAVVGPNLKTDRAQRARMIQQLQASSSVSFALRATVEAGD